MFKLLLKLIKEALDFESHIKHFEQQLKAMEFEAKFKTNEENKD